MVIAAPEFRFEADTHSYFLGAKRLPSITQLLDLGQIVSGAAYFTEASRNRGTEVHRLCQDYDLGALDITTLESPFRGYACGYVAACQALKPEWDEDGIEVADHHPDLGFAGRIDRTGLVFGRRTVCEIKSAVKAKHHPTQTALQAILKAYWWKLPPEMVQRLCVYVKHTGRWAVETHDDPRDFDVARRLIREFC